MYSINIQYCIHKMSLRQRYKKNIISLYQNKYKLFSSYWTDTIPMGPLDPILGLTERYNKDQDIRKVSLGVGAYRDDSGKPYVLPSVIEAEKRLLNSGKNKEYAGIAGVPEFIRLSLEFVYGTECKALQEGRIAAVQTISGTGGCRLVAEFFKKFLGNNYPMYLPNPTWGNHIPIMKDAGLDVRTYSYYNKETKGLDINNLLKDIRNAPEKSIFLLHACAHNPTGVDPNEKEWELIATELMKKNHLVFFDCAYQGFASGDPAQDAKAVRMFVDKGINIFLCQSYAKNFGLYGERVGLLSYVAKNKDEKDRIESQLKIIIRPNYSNPPIHGAHIVATILKDKDKINGLKTKWYNECKSMADRIIKMRLLLRENIEKYLKNTSYKNMNWVHITNQIGMFCYTGLNEKQVQTIIDEHHIYLTKDGRISMAGITTKNVDYVAKSIANVISK